jgi:predicted metalloprotease with PDZ domain
MIRDASDNKRGLDDVFRELYQADYKQKWTGFTGEQWWAAVSRAAGGKSFDEFNAKYVDGREPMPLASVLPLAGFRLTVDSIREPRLGVSSAPDSSGVRVVEVQPGSPRKRRASVRATTWYRWATSRSATRRLASSSARVMQKPRGPTCR